MRSSWTMLKLRPGTFAGLALAGAASFGALVGCIVTNPNHCGLNQGACGDGLTCSMCAIDNNGCVPAGTALEETCQFLGGTTEISSTTGPTTTVDPTSETTQTTSPTIETTVDPSTSTSEVTVTTDTTDGTTLVTDSTTSQTECQGPVVDNDSCGGVAPYCVMEACVSCKGIKCDEEIPEKPACDENSGVCVQCVTDDDCDEVSAPACDTSTATCTGCTEHSQCKDTACNLDTGECFPDDPVYYVDNTTGGMNPCSDVKDGFGDTPEKPFCTLAAALAEVSENMPTTIKVKVGAVAQETPTGLAIGNYIVAIVHYGQSTPSIISPYSDPMLTFSPGNKIYMNRINLRNKTQAISDRAIQCDGATLWLDHQRIVNTKTAIRAVDCIVHVRHSVLNALLDGGIDMSGSAEGKSVLFVENSFMTENGTAIAKFGPILLRQFARADLRYTTIALNKHTGPTVDCLNFMGKVDIRNSVLIEQGPKFGADCGANEILGVDDEAADQNSVGKWFSSFTNGEFRAKIGGELAGKANWDVGDPIGDYDGDARPPEDPTPDYAGADQPE